MSKPLIIGDYIAAEQRPAPLSSMRIRVSPLDLIMNWRRCGLTADYMASFFAYHFVDVPRATNLLSTVINEMVENCVQYSADTRTPVSISASHFGEIVTLETTNRSHSAQVEVFTSFMDRLLIEDAESLFLARIELNALLDEDTSGLGLITVKKDYLSGIGVRVIFDHNTQHHDVAVQLHLDAEQIDEI